MADIAFMDLEADRSGALLQKCGVLSAEQLLAGAVRRHHVHDPNVVNRIRLMTVSSYAGGMRDTGVPPPQMYGALAVWLKANSAFASVQAIDTGLARWSAGKHMQSIPHSHLDEVFGAWLRSGNLGEVLIEVENPQRDAVHAVWHTINQLLGPLLESAPSATAAPAAPSPAEALEADATAGRIAVSKDWPTAAEVSRRLGSTAANASHLATKLRRDGKLLGVYLPGPTPSYRFPSWQFRPDGQPVEKLPEILAVLREQGPFTDEARRTTGWGEVEWFLSGHLLLDGETPADVLSRDPMKVLEAATVEFGSEA